MDNFYEKIRDGLFFNKFMLDGVVCVEYSCPIPDEEAGIWAQSDYIVHVLSGRKSWRTTKGTVEITGGDTVYVKKGATFVRQFFDDDFCMLGFFVSDDFIRRTVNETKKKTKLTGKESGEFDLFRITETRALTSFFQSMLHHFGSTEKPENVILELKFKELLVNLLTSRENEQLAGYFVGISHHELPSLPDIMENNYYYNLSTEEFAKLCHRSLSSFKRDFQKHYNSSPGKWLLHKRLDHAAMLLQNNPLNVSRVAYESGFENTSHFSRTFKEKFGTTPLSYKTRTTR